MPQRLSIEVCGVEEQACEDERKIERRKGERASAKRKGRSRKRKKGMTKPEMKFDPRAPTARERREHDIEPSTVYILVQTFFTR